MVSGLCKLNFFQPTHSNIFLPAHPSKILNHRPKGPIKTRVRVGVGNSETSAKIAQKEILQWMAQHATQGILQWMSSKASARNSAADDSTRNSRNSAMDVFKGKCKKFCRGWLTQRNSASNDSIRTQGILLWMTHHEPTQRLQWLNQWTKQVTAACYCFILYCPTSLGLA